LEATPTPRERAGAVTRSARALDRATIIRIVVIAVFLAIALFVLPTIGADWTTTFTSVAIYSVITLGLGLLYGRVGLISLGQVALLVIGVWTATRLNFAVHLPFPVLLLVTGAITCVVGVLIGLPAIRLSGLYLALITLMAAGAVNVVLVAINFPNGGGGFTGRTDTPDLSGLQPVRRPAIAEGDTAYYRYVVVVAAVIFLVALLHVRGKPGRAWAAIRESEPAALAAGVNIVLYKMWAFALASFMAGVAGAMLAAQVGQPTAQSTTLIGGIYSLWGAVVAGCFSQLLPFLFQVQWGINPNFVLILFGAGLLQVLLTAPGGLAQQFPKDMANLARLIRRGLGKVVGRGAA
jgi:branched-chain amino acid transport system permease protein